MSRQIIELENLLQQMLDEHKRMLSLVETQQQAMKAMQLDVMEEAMHRQEASRLRIVSLEAKRRIVVQQLTRGARLAKELTLQQIAAAAPQNGKKLLALRDELKKVIKQVADRSYVAGKIASGVVGHLNTAMRLFAGAVGQAGTYTRGGTPRVANRIGVMEAIA